MDTSAFGWPISAPIKRVGSKLYVEARETLSPYGYFNSKQCKKGAYKQLEDFLKQRHVAAYTIQKWYVSTKNQLIFLNFLLFLILLSFLWHTSLILVVNC